MWEGVLHMPPAPSREHQRIGTQLVIFLANCLARSGIAVDVTFATVPGDPPILRAGHGDATRDV